MNNLFINITKELELKGGGKGKRINLEGILKEFESQPKVLKKSKKLDSY